MIGQTISHYTQVNEGWGVGGGSRGWLALNRVAVEKVRDRNVVLAAIIAAVEFSSHLS